MYELIYEKFPHYSPIADILTIIICILLILLLSQTFVTRDNRYRLFQTMLMMVTAAGFLNLSFHGLFVLNLGIPVIVIHALRLLAHVCLFVIPFLYVLYICDFLQIEKAEAKKFIWIAGVIYVGVILLDLFGSIFGFGFMIYSDGTYKLWLDGNSVKVGLLAAA